MLSRMTLRSQVALLLTLALLPVGVLEITQGYANYKETRKLRRTALAQKALDASSEEHDAIFEAFGALSGLDPQIDASGGDKAGCDALLLRFVRSSSASFAGVFSANGRLLCGHPFVEIDLSDSPEFQRFIANPRRTVTAYADGAISGEAVLAISAPVYRNRELVASIAVSLPSQYLRWVASRNIPDSNARFAIVDRRGTVITHGGSDADWLPSADVFEELLEAEDGTVFTPANGANRVYSVTSLFKNDIYAVASWPVSALKGPSGISWLAPFALPLSMWLLAVGAAYYAVDRFALRHVLYLDRLVRAYGRSGRRLRASGIRKAPREIAMLGESFDTMAEEIERREGELRGSLEEKNTLLKEVYHRVKNNLQLIISLINLQIRDSSDEGEREQLLRLQDRVQGFASVHQRLYEADRLSAVRVDLILKDIALNARGMRDQEDGEVELRFDMIEHVETPDRALPLALFGTEAIANAFKHALAFGTEGWMEIALREGDEPETLCLEISNEIVEGRAASAYRTGIGSQLIRGFASQLRGTAVQEKVGERYVVRLDFPILKPQDAAEPLLSA